MGNYKHPNRSHPLRRTWGLGATLRRQPSSQPGSSSRRMALLSRPSKRLLFTLTLKIVQNLGVTHSSSYLPHPHQMDGLWHFSCSDGSESWETNKHSLTGSKATYITHTWASGLGSLYLLIATEGVSGRQAAKWCTWEALAEGRF